MVLSMYGAHEVDANRVCPLQPRGRARRPCRPADAARVLDGRGAAQRVRHRPQSGEAAVAVTIGLMQQLSREELAGVIAHELAHIKNHDTLLMTITATIAGAISMVAQFGMFFGGNRDNNNGPGIIGSIAMMILAPLGAMLVQMAIAAPANTPPTISARASAASRCGWPRHCRRSRTPPTRCRTWKPSAIRRPRTCSSSTRCRPRRRQSVCDPPLDREPHRGAAAARGGNGRAGRNAPR